MMDYYYPAKGGVQAIPDLLSQCIIKNHGEVRCQTLVERIIVEHGAAAGVMLKGGEMIRAPFVINNGDLRRTFSEMLPQESVPDAYGRQLHNSRVSESVFSVYLGVDMAPEHIPTQGCPHILMMPEYTAIDHNEITSHPDFYRYALIMISLPSLHDRTLAPKGKSVVILQTPASIDSLDRWGTRDGVRTRQYRAHKKRIARQVIANVEKLIPNLSERIEVQIESTPFTLRDYTLNSSGAAVGWTYHPRQTFRGGLKGLLGSSNTPVKNLYQVGHWTMSPGGAPAGFITGKIVSSTILRRLRWGR
jgi:phytoene dehydrogenase-like protein